MIPKQAPKRTGYNVTIQNSKGHRITRLMQTDCYDVMDAIAVISNSLYQATGSIDIAEYRDYKIISLELQRY